MESVHPAVKAFRLIIALVLAFAVSATAVVLGPSNDAAGQAVPLANIAVEVDPAPTAFVVNDGTMTMDFKWTIEYTSTPSHYTFEVRTSGGDLVAGTDLYTDISSVTPPVTVHNPEWPGPRTWNVPLGQSPGNYVARVEYHSDQGMEQAAESVFYVRDKAHLTAIITSPADATEYNTNQQFTVNATISNSGYSQANGTTATLSIDQNAYVVSGPIPPGPWDIPSQQSQAVSWIVQCDASGPSTITVDPAGTDGTSGSPIPEANTDEDQITVQQVLKAHLTAVITAPPDGTTYNTSTNFIVTAEITNPGEADALNVQAELLIDDNAHVVGGANPQPLGNIPGGGGPVIATWTVHCDAPGDSVLTVDPTGTDANTQQEIIEDNTDEDSITVHQEEPPPPPPMVPSLTQWGIAAMIGLFALLIAWQGGRRLTRRRAEY